MFKLMFYNYDNGGLCTATSLQFTALPLNLVAILSFHLQTERK